MDRRNNYSEDCRALSVLVKAMIAGILFFCGIAVLAFYSGELSFRFRHHLNIAFSTGLVLSAAVIIGARLFHVKSIQALKDSSRTGKQKLQDFRGIAITHMALCEFVALAGVICFMVFGSFLFFIIIGMALAEMLGKFPTVEKIDAVVNSGTA